MSTQPYNKQIRVSGRGGWFAALSKESQGKALDRVLPDLNKDGFRVALIIPDRVSGSARFWYFVIGCLTLGCYYPTEGLLIIGERVDDTQILVAQAHLRLMRELIDAHTQQHSGK